MLFMINENCNCIKLRQSWRAIKYPYLFRDKGTQNCIGQVLAD